MLIFYSKLCNFIWRFRKCLSFYRRTFLSRDNQVESFDFKKIKTGLSREIQVLRQKGKHFRNLRLKIHNLKKNLASSRFLKYFEKLHN